MSSGVKRSAAPQAQGGGGGGVAPKLKAIEDMPSSHTSTNGSGPTPLTYSSGDVADDVNMNEVDGKVALEVVLPSGKSSNVTVDSR